MINRHPLARLRAISHRGSRRVCVCVCVRACVHVMTSKLKLSRTNEILSTQLDCGLRYEIGSDYQ